MKTEELTALGLTQDQATKVLVMHGTDIETHKKKINALELERDGLKQQLSTAENTLKGFEGIDPGKIQEELETYKQQAEEAERHYAAQLTARDQQDWLKSKLDKYGVASPYARKQLAAECMAQDSGLSWKDGAFFGFDDFMKAAKEKDPGLYQSAEEKAAAAKAPQFTGPAGEPAPKSEKYTPPKIF